MIRPLRPTDVIRYALSSHLRDVNRVHVVGGIVKGDPCRLSLVEVFRETLAIPRGEYHLVWESGRDLLGLASARERSGPRASEISQLFLAAAEEGNGIDLMERLSQLAAGRGAKRIFLRIGDGDPLEDSCRRAGFFPCYRESLYRGQANATPLGSGSSLPLRPRVSLDEHALFRLYNAVVPHKVRTAVGLTMEEWRDGQERCPGSCKEMVYESDEGIGAWLRTTGDSKMGHLEVLFHPGKGEVLDALLDQGLRDLGDRRVVSVIVPEYQGPLHRLLEERGLEETSKYLVMVKFMARRVEEKAAASTKAAPIQG